jgi:hypothetical protein
MTKKLFIHYVLAKQKFKSLGHAYVVATRAPRTIRMNYMNLNGIFLIYTNRRMYTNYFRHSRLIACGFESLATSVVRKKISSKH